MWANRRVKTTGYQFTKAERTIYTKTPCSKHLPIYLHTPITMFQGILTIAQRDATQSSLFIILQVHSTYFGCQPHPSSGVHKTVTTASSTCHIFFCSYLPPKWPLTTLEGGSCTVPEAEVTVLCTPDDGRG